MADTISCVQGAFVKTDLILIANEVVQECQRSRKEGPVLKLDFEKAYDRVEWDFFFGDCYGEERL